MDTQALKTLIQIEEIQWISRMFNIGYALQWIKKM